MADPKYPPLSKAERQHNADIRHANQIAARHGEPVFIGLTELSDSAAERHNPRLATGSQEHGAEAARQARARLEAEKHCRTNPIQKLTTELGVSAMHDRNHSEIAATILPRLGLGDAQTIRRHAQEQEAQLRSKAFTDCVQEQLPVEIKRQHDLPAKPPVKTNGHAPN